jgi:hypothetical protein
MKIKLKNVSQVSVGGQLPGAEFRVEADNETTPKDRFWRKMLKNADGIILVQDTAKEAKRETLTLSPNEGSSSKKSQVKKEEAA